MLHSVTGFALPYFLYTKFTISTLSKSVRYESPKSVLGPKALCSIADSHVFTRPGKNLTDLLLCGVLTPFGDLENNVVSLFKLVFS